MTLSECWEGAPHHLEVSGARSLQLCSWLLYSDHRGCYFHPWLSPRPKHELRAKCVLHLWNWPDFKCSFNHVCLFLKISLINDGKWNIIKPTYIDLNSVICVPNPFFHVPYFTYRFLFCLYIMSGVCVCRDFGGKVMSRTAGGFCFFTVEWNMVTGDHQELQREMVERETEPLCQTGQSGLP